MTSNRTPPNLGLAAPGTVPRRTSSSNLDDRRAGDGEEVGGRDGDVLGLTRNGRVRAQEIPANRRSTKAPRYDRASLRVDYSKPVSQAARPRTIDCRSSFHFNHTTIRKAADGGGEDQTNGPGAAAEHCRYIERESAVAIYDPAAIGFAMSGIIDELDRSVDADAYITRSSAVAAGETTGPVLFTNISPDADVRRAYWRSVEACARESGPSTIKLNTAADDPFWQRARQQPTCPVVIGHLLDEVRRGSGAVTVSIQEAKQVSSWLRKQPGYNKSRPPALIRVGRAGHIQYRIHGSLPLELSPQGRINALKAIAAEFEEDRLPYVAVLHAPDHRNDARNWHYHIIYHDRPIARMPNGRWDFETRRETYDGRKRQSTATLAQPKVRAVSHKDWVPTLRSRVAEIINKQLAAEGHALRLDPGRHDQMGISTPPQKSLGSKASALEKQGFATPTGTRNADRYWTAEKAAIEKQFESALADNFAEQRRLQAEVRASSRSQGRFLKPLGDITSEGGAAANLTREAALIAMAYRRDRSRADFVVDVSTRQLDAIAQGTATTAEARQEDALRQRLAEARAHLAGVERAHANALSRANQLIVIANGHKAKRDASRDLIKGLLAETAESRGHSLESLHAAETATTISPAVSPAREVEPPSIRPSRADPGTIVPYLTGDTPISASPQTSSQSASATARPLVPEAVSATAMPTRSPAPRDVVPTSRLPELSQRPQGGHAEVSVPNKVEAAMLELASVAVRIRQRDDGYRVDDGFLEQWGVAPPVIASAPMQRRLAAMATLQNRELTRLHSFTSRGPTTVAKVDGVWRLTATAPAELKVIDEKWAADALVQQYRETLAARPQPLRPPSERATERHEQGATGPGAPAVASLAKAPPASAPVQAPANVDHGATNPVAGIKQIRAMIDEAGGNHDAQASAKRAAVIRSPQTDIDPVGISLSASNALRSTMAADASADPPRSTTLDSSASRERQLSAAGALPPTRQALAGRNSGTVEPTARAVAALVGRMFHHVEWSREDFRPVTRRQDELAPRRASSQAAAKEKRHESSGAVPTAVPPPTIPPDTIRRSMTNAVRAFVDWSR